jgi:hypothetical protein
LPFLPFEPAIQAELDQKLPKNPGKHLQHAHEVPVLVDNGNCYARDEERLMIQ